MIIAPDGPLNITNWNKYYADFSGIEMLLLWAAWKRVSELRYNMLAKELEMAFN